MNNLLYDEHPLIVNPILATLIGLNEAIVLQQVHYWIEIEKKSKDKEVIEKHYHDGKWWIYNTYEQWQQQFPFWTKRGIRGIITKLEKKHILISGNYNKFGYDHTKWYTIDYGLLENLKNSDVTRYDTSKCHECTDGSVIDVQTNTIDYPKTTSNEYVKCKMVQNSKSLCTNDYSYEIVVKQIKKICITLKLDEEKPLNTILYYLKQYEKYMGKCHPKMQNKHYQRIIEFIADSEYDENEYSVMIDKHFSDTNYGQSVDYNMLHFFTEGIISNRMYETIY